MSANNQKASQATPIGFRVPPQAVEVEKHVIGAMLLDSTVVPLVSRVLKSRDFYLERHQVLYEAILTIANRREVPDLLTIAETLRKSQALEVAGGERYLMEISAEVVSSANVDQHAEIVREKSLLRDIVSNATKLLERAYRQEDGPEALMDDAEKDIAGLRASGGSAGGGLRRVPPSEAKRLALDAYDAPLYRGESTGWPGIDQYFRVSPGQMTVVTGIPNHGKSEWLDALVMNLAIGSKWRTGYFSPENSPLRRHLQKMAEKVLGKRLYGEYRFTRAQYEEALDSFILKQFEFLDQGLSGATFDQVLAEFSRITPKINCAVVDPWNRLESNRKGLSETEYIGHCLVRGQRFVQQTGIHLFIVSHPQKLTRDPKTGAVAKPGLYDISGSAHWANMVDNGIMVFRDFKEKRTEIHLLKVRFKDNGHPGMALQKYEMDSGRYIDYTEADDFAVNDTQNQSANSKTGVDFKKRKKKDGPWHNGEGIGRQIGEQEELTW